MTRRGLARTVAVVIALAAVSRAHAQSVPDDEALIRQGVELRRAGRDQDALVAFRAAYRARPTAHALGQIGLAEQALGQWTDAARDLEQAARDTQDPWIAKNGGSLTQALAKVERHLGRLQVLGTPEGATVSVDDQAVGKLPLPAAVRVAAGEVVISVSAPGHIAINRRVMIEIGQTTRETIVLHRADDAPTPAAAATLAPAPAVAAVAPATVAAAPAPTVAVPSLTTTAPPPQPGSPYRMVRVAAWTTAGIAAAALAWGVLENALYLGKRSDFDHGVAAGPCGSGLPDRGAAGCSSLYDDLGSAKTLAITGFVVAGVVGVGSAVLFAVAAKHPDEPQRVACGIGGASVGCRISF